MTELLYNKSKAVAALNKVEGFNPLELARRISNEGEAEQLYLDVKYRKLWFRLLNPTGKIISNIISGTGREECGCRFTSISADYYWLCHIFCTDGMDQYKEISKESIPCLSD